MLKCADDSIYVGSARDLDTRVQQHALGHVDSYTDRRRPVTLVWAQECEHVEDAFVLEHKLKGWRRAKKLALIEGRLAELAELARAGKHPNR